MRTDASAEDEAGLAPARWRVPLVAAALALAGWGTLRWASGRPELVEEAYSDGLYPRVRALLLTVARLSEVSLAESVLALLALFFAWRVARALRCLARGEAGLGRLAARGLATGLTWAACGYLVFLLAWGAHHARRPYVEHLGWTRSDPDPPPVDLTQLDAFVGELVANCNAQRPWLRPGAFRVPWGSPRADDPLSVGFAALARDVPVLAGPPPVLRRAVSAPLLSRLGIAGIYAFFTAECHVNDRPPDWTLPFSACHEVAHQRGFAREDEANFIAWQVCRRSRDPGYSYSAGLVALGFASRALAYHDPQRAAHWMEQLVPSVRTDLEAARAFWTAQRSPLTNLAQRGNDLYLRSQGQAAGVDSYGHVLRLMLRERTLDRTPSGAEPAGTREPYAEPDAVPGLEPGAASAGG